MGCFSMPKGVPNNRYTPEFKEMVVKRIRAENQRLRAELAYLKNCKPWFWKKSDTKAKNKGDPGTEARTRSGNPVGSRSAAKGNILLSLQKTGIRG